MLKSGILNPQINSLLSRVRHINKLVTADRGFPFWRAIETVDVSVEDDLPTVLQVSAAIRPNFQIGKAWMATEFLKANNAKIRSAFAEELGFFFHWVGVTGNGLHTLKKARTRKAPRQVVFD